MKFTFDKQGASNYLVYALEANDKVDSLSLGMIQNNKITGICPILVSQMDTTKYFKYNISAKVSMKQVFEGIVNRVQILGIFSSILTALEQAEEYMIDETTLLIDPDYIYVDISNYTVELICVPLIKELTKTYNLHEFFKKTMFHARFDEHEDTSYAIKIISFLNRTEGFQAEHFKELLEQLQREDSNPVKKNRVMQTEINAKSQMPQSTQIPQSTQLQQPTQIPQSTQLQQPTQMPQPMQLQQPTQIPQSTQLQQPMQMPQSTQMPQPAQQPLPVNQGTQVGADKQMSLFYLLCHYSSDNLKTYKSQKPDKAQKSNKPQKPKKQKGKKGNPQPMTGVPQPNMIPKVVESQAIPQPVTIAPKGNASFAIPQPVMPAEQAVPLQQQRPIQSKVADFGDTTILSSATANETTILSDDQLFAKKQAKLVRVNNRETILINKRVFKIGKAQDYADYYIADNVAISRSHAMIIQLDGEYYIEDTNSTNHTYVDGQLIQSNVRVKLADGQKISLANEEFEFHIG